MRCLLARSLSTAEVVWCYVAKYQKGLVLFSVYYELLKSKKDKTEKLITNYKFIECVDELIMIRLSSLLYLH